jgi:hypothetical protein
LAQVLTGLNLSYVSFKRKTLVSDIAKIFEERKEFYRSRWRFCRKEEYYPISLHEKMRGSTLYRWDPCHFVPMNREAETASSLLPNQLEQGAKSIDWTPGKMVVISNWRVAHARDLVDDERDDERRCLTRVSIWR